ncbi:hypothetical protein [Actinokineospora spheciospongiae]|uniref:hypothetical protein n=1 Tax=Actinokineospora spheciospongiae TaxID=909613 RepID=UPI000D715AD2|nr:hypothetical protein [Actinokineospora spheciospongiae]PWW53667.1 hypothetical protein DFQ13_11550 [Actinokineospora spheciospongiae]
MTDPNDMPFTAAESDNPWRDDQVLLGGLTQVNVALSTYLEHLIREHTEGEAPLSASVVGALGISLIEVGMALTGRVVNALPKDMPAPVFPDPATMPKNRQHPGSPT